MKIIEKIHISEKYSPLAFLAALFLAFGLLLPVLGIYQDDWLFVYNSYARGPQGLWDFLYYDGTPFASLLNIALFAILGFKPLVWHIGVLIARWLTVTVFWMVLRKIWPNSTRQNFLAALIFTLHPFYTLQPLSYTFLHAWLGYFSLGLSFYWMLCSVTDKKRFWLYLGLSLLTEAITILTLEYFAGLEFLRPILLWLVLRDEIKDPKQRIVTALRMWIPYIIVFGIYIFWRFFIYSVPIKDRNDPVVVKALLTNPLAGIQMIVFNLVPDSLLIVIASWFNVLNPASFDWFDRTNLYLTLFSILVGSLAWVYLSRQSVENTDESLSKRLWTFEAFWLGWVIVVFGLIPPYVGGLFINEKNPMWNSRFGLASMLGASMILVSIIESLITSQKARFILFAALVGLSVSYHAHYMNDFRWTWKKQENFYRQFVLRIPSLEPNTAIITEGEFLVHMGDYPTAYAINTMLAQPRSDSGEYVNYWFYSISSNFGNRIEEFMKGTDITDRHRSLRFKSRSDQSLILSFEPEQGQCLYVIRPEDGFARTLPTLIRDASHLSAPERIHDTKTSGSFLQLIGFSYPMDWCTYYQQADLARQHQDWQQIAKLWKAAHADGLAPEVAFEYLPFIEAFTRLDEWDQAVQLTLLSSTAPPSSRFMLCDFWQTLPASHEKDSAFAKVRSGLACASQ